MNKSKVTLTEAMMARNSSRVVIQSKDPSTNVTKTYSHKYDDKLIDDNDVPITSEEILYYDWYIINY